MGFFFRIIAFMDSIVLVNLFLSFFTQSIGIDIVLTSEFSCIFFNFFLRVSFQASSWLNVFVTKDRLISIKYAYKRFEFNKNKKILSIIMFSALILIVTINVPNFFMYNLQYSYNNQSLTFCTSSTAIYYAKEAIHILSRTVCPFLIMLVANINLIMALRKSKLKFKRDKSMKREYYFASSLIIMNSMFLALLIPLELSKILATLLSSQLTIFTGVITIIYYVTTYISAFNHFSSFFINLKFNKIFYKEVCRCINEIKELFGIKTSIATFDNTTQGFSVTIDKKKVFTIAKSNDS
ncbi:unnamed protein product [Brachionus calyciflorus]|uniref:G-protein coupled receptors family 1 profile domain-containing protein n=1 Tax=Brachionus calyciflorus TaxID=104777 RepID=A0A813WEX2_9BILA|nr:unnamed protein product [Brachionus calyciflorus]